MNTLRTAAWIPFREAGWKIRPISRATSCARIGLALAFGLFALGRPPLLHAQEEERFQCIRTTVKLPETGVFASYTLLTQASQFSFIPPHGSSLEVDRYSRKIKLNLPRSQGYLSLQPTTNSIALLLPEGIDELTQLVQDRYPDARIGPVKFCPTPMGRGCYFDIEQVTAYKTRLTTRLLFMPSPEGIAEMSLTTATANFGSLHQIWFVFLDYLHVQPAKPPGESPPPGPGDPALVGP